MGINKLPNWRIHCENLSKVLVISKAITRNRLGDIPPSLHYNDNTLKFNHSDPPMGISRKWSCENMQQSHRRIHMTKCISMKLLCKYQVSSKRDLKKKCPGTMKESVDSSKKLVVFLKCDYRRVLT